MTVIVDNVPQKIQGSQDQFYEAHMNKILLRTSNGFVQLQAEGISPVPNIALFHSLIIQLQAVNIY